MKNKINVNRRDIVVLIIIACVVLFVDFKYVIGMRVSEYLFANQMEKIAVKNEEKVFSVDKIIFYSSANAIDNSEGQVLQDLDVCQYTDIAVYIDNTNSIDGLTGENTVKELYIDNVKIKSTIDKGEKQVAYKNISNFGKFMLNEEDPFANMMNNQQKDKGTINFNIMYTNEDNEKNNYDNPVFYTDCSNPITLGYTNKNILTNYTVPERTENIVFDGSILKAFNVDLQDINCNVSFDIHIKNNLDEEFVCNVGSDMPLEAAGRSIYDGYIYGMKSNLQDVYTFFKI